MIESTNQEKKLEEVMEHDNPDYPLAIYYVEPNKMYLNRAASHWHGEIEIDLVRRGTAIFRIDGTEKEVTEGQAILISPNHLHKITSGEYENCVILSLIFHPMLLFPNQNSNLAQSYLLPFINDKESAYQIFDRTTPKGRAILSYIEEIISFNFEKDYGYELMTQSSLCQLWMLIIKDIKRSTFAEPEHKNEKTETPDMIRIKDALTFIHENYADSITLEDIADSIHVSKSECCRCFKRAMELSPFEYLMRYRIRQAAIKMQVDQKEEFSISDIAFSVGFNNASYFNKLFKTYLNCTPSQFRKKSKTEHRDQLSHYGLSLSHI